MAVFAPRLYLNGPQREWIHCGQIGSLVVGQPSHPILLVSLQGPMQEISGHLLILVQPLDDERLKPPGMESRGRALTSLVPITLCLNTPCGLGWSLLWSPPPPGLGYFTHEIDQVTTVRARPRLLGILVDKLPWANKFTLQDPNTA